MIEELREYIKNEIIGDSNFELSIEQDLLISGLIDSMNLIQIVSYIEEKISKKIPATDIVIGNFRNIQAMSDYIETLKK